MHLSCCVASNDNDSNNPPLWNPSHPHPMLYYVPYIDILLGFCFSNIPDQCTLFYVCPASYVIPMYYSLYGAIASWQREWMVTFNFDHVPSKWNGVIVTLGLVNQRCTKESWLSSWIILCKYLVHNAQVSSVNYRKDLCGLDRDWFTWKCENKPQLMYPAYHANNMCA